MMLVDVINEFVNQVGPLEFLFFIFGSIFIVFLLWKSILWFTPKEREKRKLEAEKRKLEAEKKARRYRRMGWKMEGESRYADNSHHHDYNTND